jgi:hypothetical protein
VACDLPHARCGFFTTALKQDKLGNHAVAAFVKAHAGTDRFDQEGGCRQRFEVHLGLPGGLGQVLAAFARDVDDDTRRRYRQI